MAFLQILLGGFTWICEGELNIGFSCIQRSIIDVVNLLFLCGFYLLLLVGYLGKRKASHNSKLDWVSIVVSVCCALISVVCLGIGLRKTESFKNFRGLVHLLRGLIWTSLAVSLLVQRSKWIKILSSVWWVSFSLLVSALCIENLSKTHSIQLSETLQWPVSILLLFCALRNFINLAKHNTEDKGLHEPLLEEKVEEKKVEPPKVTSFSKLIFSWVNPLLSLGYSKPLALNDIPPLNKGDKSDLAYQKFADAWESLLREKKSSDTSNLLLKAIARVYLKENIFVAFCAFLRTIAVVALPILLFAFIKYSTKDEANLHEGLFLVGCLILCMVVESLTQRHWFFYSRRSGMRIRSALMAAIYQKQLRLSSLGRKKHSTGEIVNYVSVDAYRMGEFPWWLHLTWSLSLQIFLFIGVLFFIVGLGAIVGLVPLLICGYLNVPFARLLQKFQSKFMVAQDKRLRATTEILNNMKVIKLQSWEEKFKNLIESLREDEFKWLAEQQYTKPKAIFLYWVAPTVVSSVIFLGCALFGSAPLNASTIFTVLAALRGMSDPVSMIPEALSIMIQVKVSLERINTFLLDHELMSTDIRVESAATNFNRSVEIHAGNFSWDPEVPNPTIRDVTLEIYMGQKIAICGPVGAGKSSLLHAMLGEMPKVSGNVHISGSIAYVSQTSWIQSGTVRDNILYGKPMDIGKYKKVVKACALDKDINSFPHGDLTEIGQRGINMSGGQKQRIQLARAVYNDAEIYLLDDPFSAVDAHTASSLFKDCVMTALQTKTVILVTHQMEFLSDIDRILVMKNGKITQSGRYEDLLMAGSAFEQLVTAHRDAATASGTLYTESPGEFQKLYAVQLEDSIGIHPDKQKSEEEISAKGPQGMQLTEEEEKEIGDVGWKPFQDYLLISNGSLLLLLMILAQATFIILQAAATYWLSYAIEIPKVTSGMLIGTYAGISTFSTAFVYLRALLTVHLGLKASRAFFSGFTNAIFKAPMLFFDSTPIGRILTRASSDLSILDFDIPFASTYVALGITELLVTIGIVAFVTWPALILAMLTMVAIRYIQDYYLATARELMRINGTTKAPVMNFAAETSLGIVTIRAFNTVDVFFRNYLKLVDMDAKLFFFSNATMEWLVLRIETLQNLTLFFAAFLIVLLPKGHVAPGLVGLSLSYALNLSSTQIYLSRWYCNLSNYMISVERIKQFMNTPPEPPAIVEDMRPPSSWPSKGRIELHELKIRYRPNAPLVLKGMTCTFEEGTRVGVVGRTGSGKTTLISALFRLVKPASGKILMDGVDICTVGLKDLRINLSIIPQEATLFRGNVRTNLDPLGLYSDAEIWKALEKCQLKATVSNLPNKLETTVSDEGDNWSAGQRQLFCLGRVLLKRNRILVLDEATASIDSATDAIIQRIIREEFSDCTVITVAHRVPTVIDSDRVMVLSYGNLVEYDEPLKLMETNSSFSKLVAEYWSSFRRNSSIPLTVRA